MSLYLSGLFKLLLFSFFIFFSFHTDGQTAISLNKYGLAVIGKARELRKSIEADSAKMMVNITALYDNIETSLPYASTNNFMHRRMYPAGTKNAFLRILPAEALGRVVKKLKRQGLSLKIFDAYRPYSITEKFWDMVKDDRYVANPSKGSGHNRGLSVDLTIIDLFSGKELDMGTGFDNFSDTAHHSFTDLPKEVVKNRKLLRSVMEAAGFRALETEWWHYSWPDQDHGYELLDIPIGKM